MAARAGRGGWRGIGGPAFRLPVATPRDCAHLRLWHRRRHSRHLPAPDPYQSRNERDGLIAALLLVVQTIFFFIFYQQMSTSLNLFAQNNVDLNFSIFGWHLFKWIPEQYQNLNSIWIVLLSPVLVFIYNTLGRSGKDPSIATKFAWGFGACAIGFFNLWRGARWAVDGKVSSWIMVLGLRPLLSGRVCWSAVWVSP